MAPTSILIVGCSIAGPTLASYLLLASMPAAEKPHITILERSSVLRTQGQNIDVRGPGVEVIRRLGLETAVRASTTGEDGMQFVDAQDRVCAAFPADKSGEVQTFTSDIEILRGRLGQLCYARSKALSEAVQKGGGSGIEYIFGDHIDTMDQDEQRVTVTLSKSGKKLRFDLVIAADGLQSRTRVTAWGQEGEKERLRPLGLYVAFFSMPRSESDSQWCRWFHAPGRRGIVLRPDYERDRTTALLTMMDDGDARFEKTARVDLEGIDAQKQLLQQHFEGVGWESKRVLREMMATDDFYYNMIGQVKMPQWSKGRVVLVGDAGYCPSPISGMGTTLALTGAYTLAGVLTRNPNDYTAAFAEYESKMRPFVERAQKLPPGAPGVLNPSTAWGIWIMQRILGFLAWSGIATVFARLFGPPVHQFQLEEYGFEHPAAWDDK